MEQISMNEIQLVTQNINDIITNKIFKLPYFNKTNFNINVKTFERTLITDFENFINKVPPAFYYAQNNTLYVATVLFHPALLMHEMIHMVSANIEKNIVGYADNVENYYFNEAATQYLTSKYFDNQNDSNGYGEITHIFNKLVKKYGEDIMLNGFFEANYNKFISQFNDYDKNIIRNSISEMNKIMEEKEKNLIATTPNKWVCSFFISYNVFPLYYSNGIFFHIYSYYYNS